MEDQHIQDSDRRRTSPPPHEQWQATPSTQIAHNNLSQQYPIDATWPGDWPNVEHDLGLYGNSPWESTVALDQISRIPLVPSDQLDMPLDEFWNNPPVGISSGDNQVPLYDSSVPNSLDSSAAAYMGVSTSGGPMGSTSLFVTPFGPNSMNAIPLEPHAPNANSQLAYPSSMTNSEYASALEIDNSMLQSSVLHLPLQYSQQGTMPGQLTQEELVHGDFTNQGTIPYLETNPYRNHQLTWSDQWPSDGVSAEFSENIQSSIPAHEPVMDICDSLPVTQDPVGPQPTIATSTRGLPALVEQQPSPSALQQPNSKLSATQSRQRPLAPRGSIKASEYRISKPRGVTGTNRSKQSTNGLTDTTPLDYPSFQTVFHQDSNTQILSAKKRGKYNKKACWMCQLDRKGCSGGTPCDRCQTWRQKAESESNWRKETAIILWKYCFDLDISRFAMFEGFALVSLSENWTPEANLRKKFEIILLDTFELIRTTAGSAIDPMYMLLIGGELFQKPVPDEIDQLLEIRLYHPSSKAIPDEPFATPRNILAHDAFKENLCPSFRGAVKRKAFQDDPGSFHGVHFNSADLLFVAINMHSDYLCAKTGSTAAEVAFLRYRVNAVFFEKMEALYKIWKLPKSPPEYRSKAKCLLSRYIRAFLEVVTSLGCLNLMNEDKRTFALDFGSLGLKLMVLRPEQLSETLLQAADFCEYLATDKGLYRCDDFETRLATLLLTAIVDFEPNRDTGVSISLYQHTILQLGTLISMVAEPSEAAVILKDMITAADITVNNDDDNPWQPFEQLLKHSNDRFRHLPWSYPNEQDCHSVS
ncbi:hypothetical protein BJ166DRAFT_57376 [Pestalotiopsis sp. NC0098]|nr:hypothetical protein BJ166DRAFT_57376 [Pestalotiopsis sp. NC0098]